MSKRQLEESIGIEDLTKPKYGHAIYLVIEKIRLGLAKRSDYPRIEVCRSSPITSPVNNFDKLLFPTDNLGRSSRYTRYINEEKMLRTHTSAIIPPLLEELGKTGIDDIILMCPGIIYRRDVVDKTHCGAPHQMDIWRIKSGLPYMNQNDMKDFVETIIKSLLPEAIIKYNDVEHPYTLQGLEVEIEYNGQYLEILECGQIHPEVLRKSGLNSEVYSGLASGMGLDRLVMLIKEIDDIRLLRSRDSRIMNQMKNLESYCNVSKYPAIKRDLSFSVWDEVEEEDVCDMIMSTIGFDKNVIEAISIISETGYKQLPLEAIRRLGIKPGQKNLLIRIILRSHEKSLTHEEANEIRDLVYRSINQSGTNGYLN